MSRPDVLRIYASIRSAHLERFPEMEPAQVLFHRSRYDYDEQLTQEFTVPPRVAGRWGVVAHLLRHRYRVVEVNEPNMVKRWLDLTLALLAVRLRDLVTRHHTQVVAYCIGLTDPVAALRRRYRIPPRLGRRVAPIVVTWLASRFDRLAFGTGGTRSLYATYVRRGRLDGRTALFEALPNACECVPADDSEREPGTLLFVGAFDRRKGIELTMRVWDEVRAANPDLRFHIIGTGPLADDVQAWAATRPEVSVEIDPPRAAIHAALRRAGALILLSQRVGMWREQVGLPIVEALAHGVAVVTTSETGLAGWLEEHGHAVLTPEATVGEVAGTVTAVLRKARPADDVRADLPSADQRIAADAWLMSAPRRRPIVMHSVLPVGPETNPYITQLLASTGEHVRVETFSWRRALVGRFDVYHVHWPERPIRRRSPAKSFLARLMFRAFLLRIRIARKALVRTLHNAQPHESGSRAERAVLELGDRRTTLWIRLTDTTPLPSAAPAVTIRHGHYRDWYAHYEQRAPIPGRLLYFGHVRGYKGLTTLLDAFGATQDPALTLRIVGKAKATDVADAVHTAARRDPRISATLEFVDEATLADEIGAAELVVLPFREMHNSGSALLALSLARPILVPENEVTRALRDEVGPGWVHLYAGEFTREAVEQALAAVRTSARTEPDLHLREWDELARAHVAAYRRAWRG